MYAIRSYYALERGPFSFGSAWGRGDRAPSRVQGGALGVSPTASWGRFRGRSFPRRTGGGGPASEPSQRGPEGRPGTDCPGGADPRGRITSYNVCYTKLLRGFCGSVRPASQSYSSDAMSCWFKGTGCSSTKASGGGPMTTRKPRPAAPAPPPSRPQGPPRGDAACSPSLLPSHGLPLPLRAEPRDPARHS